MYEVRDTSRYTQDTLRIHQDTIGYVSDRKCHGNVPQNDRKCTVTRVHDGKVHWNTPVPPKPNP